MVDIWGSLTQEKVFQLIETVINESLSNLIIQRNSYINRVYEVKKANIDERLIVKFYRPGRWTKEQIQEEHDFLFMLFDKDLPVIPPYKINNKSLFHKEEFLYAIFPKKGGRAFDEYDEEGWKKIGRLLGRMHLLGETIKQSSRVVWKPEIISQQNIEYLLQSGSVPIGYRQSLQNIYTQFATKTKGIFDKEEMFLIHGDCHPGNLMTRLDGEIYLIDFDDMSIGPAIQDLWMLLPDALQNSQQELIWFREGYETFREFSEQSLRFIPILKVMRIIHFAHWLCMQRHDLHFKENFPDWGTIRYWNELIRDMQVLVYSIPTY